MRIITQLLLLTMCTGSLCAQSPGGVSSPELWFRTVPVSTNLNGSYRWQDFSGDSLRLNIYDERGAAFGDEFTNSSVRFYNGNPALSLNKTLDTKTREVRLKRTNLSQAAIVGVFAPNANFDKEMLLYALNGRPGQGVLVTTDKIIPSIESGKSKFDYGQSEGMDLMYSSGDAESSVNDFRVKSMRIAAYYRSIPPAKSIWGETDIATLSLGGTYSKTNVNYNSTFSLSTAENRAFTGYIPELIAYNRLLSPLERRQVDSYLAIKYGLSLPVSLIGSNEQLLWDYAANPAYNNRITGVYRDNASGLYQRESATSYEQGPNYTDQSSNDFCHLANPNNRSSASRLLVMGRQFANKTNDGEYLFWADNNASIKLKEIEGVLGLKIMNRSWLVKTNIAPATDAQKTLEWDVNGLVFNTSGFITSVTKTSGSSAPATGVAYTKIPLGDSDGYLGLSDMSLYGELYLKFGSNQSLTSAGSHDYGYFISPDNKVYVIIRGSIATEAITTLILASSLEVEKQGGLIYLRINGSRYNGSEISIEAPDMGKAFYGAIGMTKGTFDGKFDLRHGGFVDTGNRLELSYATNLASEFKDNTKGSGFLVIDRSGSGNFNQSDVEYIKADEINTSRQKVIFNNVFFNTGDVFTFAYRESELQGEIEITDPDCNQANGEAIVKLSSGRRAFKYTLTDLNTGQVVKIGRENSYTIRLTGLKEGEYELKIEEAGGFNVVGDNTSGTPTRAKTTNFFPVFEGSLEWMVTNTSDSYMVGYTTFVEDINNAKNIIHYGLKKQGNALYKVVNGKLTSLGLTVVEGDVLKISKTMSKVTYYKNGTEIGSTSISILDYLAKFYGLIDMTEGPAEILNVNATGFFNLADYKWSAMSGITIENSTDAVLTYQFTIEDPCQGQTLPEVETQQVKAEDKLKLSYIQGSMTVRAEIEFEEPDVVSFTVFNMSGQLIQKKNLTTPQKIQMADLNVPNIGVYIIKAITTNGEYTKKLLIQ